MVASNNKNVIDFLHDLQAHACEQYEIVQAVRDMTFMENPDVIESIKYGGIVFHKDDELVGGIFTYKKHVSLEFSHGSEMDDIHSVLKGKGKYRRHVKLVSLSDVEDKKIRVLLSALS